MNKLLGTFSLFFFGIASAVCQHDKMSIKADEDEVPVAVVKAYKTDFAKAETGSWRIVTGAVVEQEYSVGGFRTSPEQVTYYSVKFTESKRDKSAVYDHYGRLMQSKVLINQNSLPNAVKQALETEFPGFAMVEGPEAVSGRGQSVSHYRVHLKSADQTKMVAVDASGRVLKEK